MKHSFSCLTHYLAVFSLRTQTYLRSSLPHPKIHLFARYAVFGNQTKHPFSCFIYASCLLDIKGNTFSSVSSFSSILEQIKTKAKSSIDSKITLSASHQLWTNLSIPLSRIVFVWCAEQWSDRSRWKSKFWEHTQLLFDADRNRRRLSDRYSSCCYIC